MTSGNPISPYLGACQDELAGTRQTMPESASPDWPVSRRSSTFAVSHGHVRREPISSSQDIHWIYRVTWEQSTELEPIYGFIVGIYSGAV
jgi:hypothetical protein